MKYIIKQSTIACIVHVNGISVIYFSDDKLPGKWSPGDNIWTALPTVVQDAVIARFKEVYAKAEEEKRAPLGRNAKAFDNWLRELPELVFEVDDADVPDAARMLSSVQLNPWYNPHPAKIVLPDPTEILTANGHIAVPA